MMYNLHMRTTVSLDKDVEAAVRDLRTSQSLGLSEAINVLARRGMTVCPSADVVSSTPVFEMHAKLDYSNVADVLDLLDQP